MYTHFSRAFIRAVSLSAVPATAQETQDFASQADLNLSGATADWSGGYVGGSLAVTSSTA